MSEELKWAMDQLREKAFGGKSGFELDEIVPKIEEEITKLINNQK